MSDVPIISIDEVEDQPFDDDDSRRPSINECHTDIEDLDENLEKRNSLIDTLNNDKCNGAVTDVEDCEDSGDDEPETNLYKDEFSLNEYLDQGAVDEHSNLQGNVNKQKLQAMHSIAKSPSPTAFHLTINQPDLGGTTDVEDMDDSGEEIEADTNFSDDDKAIILEGANIVDVHDSMNRQKKVEKYAPRVLIDRSSSSSDSEQEKSKLKLKTHHKPRKGQMRCEDAKSDVENIYFSDEDARKNIKKSVPVLETPDIEIMAFEGSDNDEIEKESFPEINITFVDNETNKKKKKFRLKDTPAPSPMLKLPQNPDDALTDVENLNSSDDDDDEDIKPIRPKTLLPIAVVKSDALTDVEDFNDSSNEQDEDEEEKLEIPLPSPVREFTVLVENKTGEPFKQTTQLPDNIYLGFEDFDADKGLTDVEDFDDSGDDFEDEPMKFREVERIELDGGFIESSDHSVVKDSALRTAITPDPKTDTEDIFLKRQSGSECRRRKTKSKHNKSAGKSLFLDKKFYVDEAAGSAHTDVEDLDLEDDDVVLKDKNVKQRRATFECPSNKVNNGDDKTDIEYFSDDGNVDSRNVMTPDNRQAFEQIDACTMTFETDNIDDVLKVLKTPTIRRISVTPRGSCVSSTDVEQIQICDSDNDEVSYSRAQTATPHEIHRQLDDLGSSQIHDVASRGFDLSRDFSEIKGNQETAEAHTDIEFFD